VTKNEAEQAWHQRGSLRWMALVGTGLILTLAGGVLKGITIAQAAAAETAHVVVDNFSFGPATAIVSVGTTVTWTNHDDIPHNVVSPEQKFKSPVLDTDEMFSHTFDVAGTFKYYCSIHPRMTGQVVVR
jgi:plastocyanin